MLNWGKKRSYITVYLNYQVFYYLFDHTVQSFCRYINYKCKESELLCFSCRWWFAPAGLLSKLWWECRLAVLQPSARLRAVVDGTASNKGFLSWAPAQEQLERASSARARSLCWALRCVRASHTRAQRPVRRTEPNWPLRGREAAGALSGTREGARHSAAQGCAEGRLMKRDRYGRNEITALGRQAI